MNWNISKTVAAAALPLIAMSSFVSAARNNQQSCAPSAPANCNPADDCCGTYCMGPENYGVNAPVRPRTCNGDFVIEIDGLYWNSHMDGMEYAVETQVKNTERTSLINANYKNPNFNWEFGFKAGVAYNTTCDGWDLGILWTKYNGRASSHDQAQAGDNKTLLPLWSNFPDSDSLVQFQAPVRATDIETSWKLDLNLIDLDLGREFWVSRRVTLRPHVGLRIAQLKQSFDIEHKGGSFSEAPVRNDFVDINNNFKGVGVRAGLDSVWNLGCGFGIYGDMALSIIYGRFNVDHKEYTRLAASPFSKRKVLDTHESFRASRLATDLALGLQWSKLVCNCQYGLTIGLGWEHHLFLDQNQMWRVNKVLSAEDSTELLGNTFSQRRGDLDTQGWTLKFVFDF